MTGSADKPTYDESWTSAVSIPMTIFTALFVNLLSQEWHVWWPVAVAVLVLLGSAQFIILRRGATGPNGRKVHGISEPYLVGIGVTAVVGYVANWLAVWYLPYGGGLPVFGSWNWAGVFVIASTIPWLMARAGRAAWMWATVLFAGLSGAQFALLNDHGALDKLGWWIFGVVVIWLTSRPASIFKLLREAVSRDHRSERLEDDSETVEN